LAQARRCVKCVGAALGGRNGKEQGAIVEVVIVSGNIQDEGIAHPSRFVKVGGKKPEVSQARGGT